MALKLDRSGRPPAHPTASLRGGRPYLAKVPVTSTRLAHGLSLEARIPRARLDSRPPADVKRGRIPHPECGVFTGEPTAAPALHWMPAGVPLALPAPPVWL